MSMPDPGEQDPPDDDTLAGEFVLGLLDPAARRRIEVRMLAEPDFAAHIADWQERLAPLHEEIGPEAVPERVWQGVQHRLFPDHRRPESVSREGLQRRLRLWRLATGLAAAACLALAVALALVLAMRGTGPAPLVAGLHGEGSGPLFLASLDPASGRLAIQPVAGGASAGQVPELWLIPPDGRPRSLGLLAAEGVTQLVLRRPLADLAGPGSALAISLEPPGGSPTGQPTGPVVAVGKVQSL